METALLKKLADLQRTVRRLAPDAQGGSSSAGYRYVTGGKVLDIVRPKMDELGLLLVQQVDGIDNERVDYQVKNGAKSEILTKVTMTFTWIDTESGESLPVKFGANGCNGWDKGLGSALTYAERYFLLKFFHIATDEDDVDARPSEEAHPVRPAVPEKPRLAISEERYGQLVQGQAEGKTTKKTGLTIRDYFIKTYLPDGDELAAFDDAVTEYRINHNIK